MKRPELQKMGCDDVILKRPAEVGGWEWGCRNCSCTRWFKSPLAIGTQKFNFQRYNGQYFNSMLLIWQNIFSGPSKAWKTFYFWNDIGLGFSGSLQRQGFFTYVENLCVQIIVRKHRFWPIIRVEKACFLPLFLLLLDKLASYKKILLVDLCC